MLEFIWVQDADEARNGLGRSLHFSKRAEDPTAGILELVSQADRLSMRSGQEHLMEITLDRHGSGRTEDYRPAMRLILRW